MALFLIVYGRFRGPTECNEQLSQPGAEAGHSASSLLALPRRDLQFSKPQR